MLLAAIAFAVLLSPAQGGTSEEELAALHALYEAAGGAGWADNGGWLGDDPPCRWFDVMCDDNSHVRQVHLHFNSLTGTVPPQFWQQLVHLEVIHFHGNQLSGMLPSEVGNLASLVRLDPNGNRFSGTIPSQVGNLRSLKDIYLGDNLLSGTIPTEVARISSLTGLTLGRNLLSGSIPSSIGQLASLQHLFLHCNRLSGSIPSQLGRLHQVEQLWLQKRWDTDGGGTNRLSGVIPTQLGNMVNVGENGPYLREFGLNVPGQTAACSLTAGMRPPEFACPSQEVAPWAFDNGCLPRVIQWHGIPALKYC